MKKRNFAKRSIALLISVVTFLSLSTAFAADVSREAVKDDNEGITTRAEELAYYYRIYNGQRQQRIWSVTYGYWKTGWTNV
ncbi:hypothetical protein LJC32_03045 [Oscillospiraceae bacterium OttesenSCG-928-F05]|nr:hypothetical protein [Oscillospiraceae bacterium OttesenSCG-928-F05]